MSIIAQFIYFDTDSFSLYTSFHNRFGSKIIDVLDWPLYFYVTSIICKVYGFVNMDDTKQTLSSILCDSIVCDCSFFSFFFLADGISYTADKLSVPVTGLTAALL